VPTRVPTDAVFKRPNPACDATIMMPLTDN